tara:strand:- start:473 stop:679 length:207 start_codon:yes stop_codon:yes gene_type:complete
MLKKVFAVGVVALTMSISAHAQTPSNQKTSDSVVEIKLQAEELSNARCNKYPPRSNAYIRCMRANAAL